MGYVGIGAPAARFTTRGREVGAKSAIFTCPDATRGRATDGGQSDSRVHQLHLLPQGVERAMLNDADRRDTLANNLGNFAVI
jgi:hypothetical protein